VVICTFRISLQHRPNSPFGPRMSATWAQLGANSRQQGPTWIHLASIWAQLGSKLDPFNFGPSWASTWAQHENITGPIRNRQNARFHWYFPLFLASMTLLVQQCSLCGALCWARLGAKLLPKAPKLRIAAPHVHHMPSSSGHPLVNFTGLPETAIL
jgi:hypothetical protein